MRAKPNSTIPVVIELGQGMDGLAAADGTSLCKKNVRSGIRVLLDRVRLAGEPEVTITQGASQRAIRVRVHGVLQPFSPFLMRRAWLAVAPAHMRHLATTVSEQVSGFPDRWFRAFLTKRLDTEAIILYDFLARLVLAVIEEHPGCLIGPTQAAAYLHAQPASSTAGGKAIITTEVLLPLLTTLVDRGVSVADRARVFQIVNHNLAFGRTILEVAEAVLPHLRTGIRIQINPEYLAQFVPRAPAGAPFSVHTDPTAPEVSELFRFVTEGLYLELGLELPDLLWAPARELLPGMVGVTIDAWNGQPMPGLQPGELLVDAPLGQMEALGLRGGPAMNPADGRLCTIVAEQDRPAVAGAGLVSWTAAEWLALFVAGEIRRMANRHLDIVEVEYKLAQLDEFSPDLVQATLQRYSPADLTVVLRALLSEGLSIRDLPLLLGLLLQYDTIPVDANTTVVLDDRLPVAEASTGQPAEEQARYLAFVRQGLKRYLSYHYAKDLVGLAVFRLEPEFEATARAANANAALFDEAEQEAVRDAVWAAIGDEPRRKRTPVLVRGPTTRMAVRRLLAPELPDLPIVAQEELLPGIAIRPVSTIDIERSLVNAAPSRRSS